MPDGGVSLKCFTGCSTTDIVGSIGLETSDLRPPRERWQKAEWDIVDVYDYPTANHLLRHVRHRNKQFQWWARLAGDVWRCALDEGWYRLWSDGNYHPYKVGKGDDREWCQKKDKKPGDDAVWFDAITERVLYKEHRIREAEPGALVLYVEGEKDMQTGTRLDFITTTAGGASDWRAEFAPLFTDLDLVIIPDNDVPGEKLAAKIAVDCYEHAERTRVVRLPDLPEKGDLSDWIEAGGSREQLLRLIDEAEEWRPEATRDEATEKAIRAAERAIKRAACVTSYDGEADPPISEDAARENRLRRMAYDSSQVVGMVMALMVNLGFQEDHNRILNALLAYVTSKKHQLAWFMATHGQLYKKYKRKEKEIHERSKAAMVARDITKLRDEQDRLGCDAIGYIPGTYNATANNGQGQGYGSKFKLDIVRYALIAIELSGHIRDQFTYKWQADEAAAQLVAGLVPRREKIVKVESGAGQAEKKAPDGTDWKTAKREFFAAFKAELARRVKAAAQREDSFESLDEAINSLAGEIVNPVNDLSAQALAEAFAEMRDLSTDLEPKVEKEVPPHIVYKNVDYMADDPNSGEAPEMATDLEHIETPKSNNTEILMSTSTGPDSGKESPPASAKSFTLPGQVQPEPPQIASAGVTPPASIPCDDCNAPIEWGAERCPKCRAVRGPHYWRGVLSLIQMEASHASH
jgi:hypothetical protein